MTPQEELAALRRLAELEAKAGGAQPSSQPGQGVGIGALRAAEFGARGVMDEAANIIGAFPELAASGLRAISPSLAPEPGYYPEAIKGAYRKVGDVLSAPLNAAVDFGPADPQSALERGAYGAGAGLVDVASFMAPGAVVAKTAQAGSLPARVGEAMMTAPAIQLASGAVGGGVGEATESPLAGLAASLAVPIGAAGAAKAITPFPSQLSANEAKLASLAEQYGIQLTPGQKTGSSPLRTMESVFSQTPFTGKAQAEIYDAQRRAFNKAVLSKAGIDAQEATPEVLDAARKSIGKEFDNLASMTNVQIDDAFVAGLKRVEDDFATYLGADGASRFKVIRDKFDDMVKAYKDPETLAVNIPGKEYSKAMSNIKDKIRKATDPYEKDALIQLQTLVDDAVERSAGPEIQAAWRDVRNRYRNMLTIDDAMKSAPATDAAKGNIPFGQLTSAVRKSDAGGFARGRGDLNEAARVGQFLSSAIPPDSGTARRSLIQSLMTGGGAGVGGGYAMAGGDPVTAALIAGGALAGPKAVQMGYSAPVVQRYLTNQAIPSGPLSRELLADIAAAQGIGFGVQ